MRPAAALLLMFVVAALQAAEPIASSKPGTEPPRYKKLQINWPGYRDREAVVVLKFDVRANGKVANIELVDDGFHEKRFVQAAIQGLQQSSWHPRRVDGKAVDTLGITTRFKFSIVEQEPGVTEEFRDEALKVDDLLKQGDYAGGEFHAQWMVSEKVTLIYEYAVLQAQLAQTYAGMGQIPEAIRKVSKATARTDSAPQFLQILESPPPNKPSNYLLSKELTVDLLAFRMRLLARQGLALEALQAYYEMAGLQEPEASLTVLAGQLVAQIRGQDNLLGKVEIGPSGSSAQFLSRRSFSLGNVSGRIDQMLLDCSADSKRITYQAGETWTVPEGWGPCKVIIVGDPETSFEFVEYPE